MKFGGISGDYEDPTFVEYVLLGPLALGVPIALLAIVAMFVHTAWVIIFS